MTDHDHSADPRVSTLPQPITDSGADERRARDVLAKHAGPSAAEQLRRDPPYYGGVTLKQALAAMAECASSRAAVPDGWDHGPNIGAPTNEPGLRDIVFGYYRMHFDAAEAHRLTKAYIAALTAAPNHVDQSAVEVERLREALGQLIQDMEQATAGGMSWIDHSEVLVFKERARAALQAPKQ